MPLSYDFTSCMTIDCPNNAYPNVAPSIPKSQMHEDVIGNYWCPRCMASEDMITALYETLIERKRAQLPLGETNEGAERVKKWLEAFDKAAAELPLE